MITANGHAPTQQKEDTQMSTNELVTKLNELTELRKMAEDLNAEIEAIQQRLPSIR